MTVEIKTHSTLDFFKQVKRLEKTDWIFKSYTDRYVLFSKITPVISFPTPYALPIEVSEEARVYFPGRIPRKSN